LFDEIESNFHREEDNVFLVGFSQDKLTTKEQDGEDLEDEGQIKESVSNTVDNGECSEEGEGNLLTSGTVEFNNGEESNYMDSNEEDRIDNHTSAVEVLSCTTDANISVESVDPLLSQQAYILQSMVGSVMNTFPDLAMATGGE